MLAGFTCPGWSCGHSQPAEKVSHQGGTSSARQLGLRHCQNTAQTQPHMGTSRWEKPAVLLDKPVSATRGPMGSPPAAHSHPACPKQTHRALPTCPHQGIPLYNDHSTQTQAFSGHGESNPSYVGPLTEAETSLRMLSLASGMLVSIRT